MHGSGYEYEKGGGGGYVKSIWNNMKVGLISIPLAILDERSHRRIKTSVLYVHPIASSNGSIHIQCFTEQFFFERMFDESSAGVWRNDGNSLRTEEWFNYLARTLQTNEPTDLTVDSNMFVAADDYDDEGAFVGEDPSQVSIYIKKPNPNGIETLLGSVVVVSADINPMEWFKELHSVEIQKTMEISQLRQSQQAFCEDLEFKEKELVDYAADLQRLKSDIQDKFYTILNSKKHKIWELTREIEKLRDLLVTDNPHIKFESEEQTDRDLLNLNHKKKVQFNLNNPNLDIDNVPGEFINPPISRKRGPERGGSSDKKGSRKKRKRREVEIEEENGETEEENEETEEENEETEEENEEIEEGNEETEEENLELLTKEESETDEDDENGEIVEKENEKEETETQTKLEDDDTDVSSDELDEKSYANRKSRDNQPEIKQENTTNYGFLSDKQLVQSVLYGKETAEERTENADSATDGENDDTMDDATEYDEDI